MRTLPPTPIVRRLYLIIIAITGLIGMPAYAASGEGIPVSLSVDPGHLTLYSSEHANLNSVTVSHTGGNDSTGQLTTYGIDDSRGSYTGWNLSATFSNLTSYTSFIDNSGQVGPFQIDGTYNMNHDLDLTLTTGDGTTGLGLGQLRYTLTDQDGIAYTDGTSQVMLSHQTIGSTGLGFAANDVSFAPNRQYHLHIGVIPASAFMIVPGPIEAFSGDASTVRAGLPARPQDSNDALSLAIADPGSTDGFYRSATDLTLSVPAGAHSGIYYGQIVETIQ